MPVLQADSSILHHEYWTVTWIDTSDFLENFVDIKAVIRSHALTPPTQHLEIALWMQFQLFKWRKTKQKKKEKETNQMKNYDFRNMGFTALSFLSNRAAFTSHWSEVTTV